MNGIKLEFGMTDLAKAWKRGIGSVRLKDGSSVKILSDDNDKAVDIFRIKNGRLLETKGYRGSDAMLEAANEVGYIEKLAQNPEDVEKAWLDSFDVIV